MAQHTPIAVVAALELLADHVLRKLAAFLPQHGLMQVGIKLLANHFHAGHPLLLQHLHQLLVQTLVTAMQRLGFLTFRIQLLTGPLEVVDDGENLREGRADQLLTHVVLVAALALAEVVEIRRNAHVLAVERLVLLL